MTIRFSVVKDTETERGIVVGTYDKESTAKRIRTMKANKDAESVYTVVSGDDTVEDVEDATETPVADDQTDPIDNAFTNYHNGISTAQDRLQFKIDTNGGVLEFPALFDLSGNLVSTSTGQGEYGCYWKLADGRVFWESKAATDEKRIASNRKRGYYIGTVTQKCTADIDGGGIGTLAPIAKRTDPNTVVEIIDNGQPRKTEEPVSLPKGKVVPENIVYMIIHSKTQTAREMWVRIATRHYGKDSTTAAVLAATKN